MGILSAILVLSLLIFVHELGHFFVARFFGVKVEVFSIGFGQKIVSKVIGDTEWKLSIIPLGGYVKMKGEEDNKKVVVQPVGEVIKDGQVYESYNTNENKIDEDSYNAKKPWQKILILLAGPFANFIFAFVLYFAIALIGVPKLLPTIGTVSKDTPAMSSNLLKGDTIKEIAGKKIFYWEDVGKAINSTNGTILMVIKRENSLKEITITPKVIEDKNIFGEKTTRKIIGIAHSYEQVNVTFGIIDSLAYGLEETKKASVLIFQSVEKLITGVVSTDKLGGVITIVDVTAKATNAGIVALFFFTAFISVNLGVLNLLPIPPLDGGHIMFNSYEMIIGKSPSDKVKAYITYFGMTILIALMFLGLFNDINRIWG